MVIIELKVYGDFDIPVTDSVWINEVLDSAPPSLTCNMFDNDEDISRAVRELKQYGFKKVKTKALAVGGNL